MSKKYPSIRFPEDAFREFMKKQKVLEDLNKKLKFKKKIYFTDTLKFFSQKPVFVYEDELTNFFRKKKKNGGYRFL